MKKLYTSFVVMLFCHLIVGAQQLTDKELFIPICDSITSYFSGRFVAKDTLRLSNIYIGKSKTAELQFSNYLCDAPLRKNDIKAIYEIVKSNMPEKYTAYRNNFKIYSNESLLDELASGALPADYSLDSNQKISKASAKLVSNNSNKLVRRSLVSNETTLNKPKNGLDGRHIALWQSHGYHYSQKSDKWIWQRPVLFGIVEDLYTQSYVLPFLVPMLENAGANVLIPRERDVQVNELIVDNDSKEQPELYVERNGRFIWEYGYGGGYAPYSTLIHGENPFKSGTYRMARCVSGSEEPSVVYWNAAVPQTGEYAVYVSYADIKSATDAAEYTVSHSGGITQFKVNQTMGGGTWIYLGTFGFDKNALNQGVYLSNLCETSGKFVSADAVKFGGGMGDVSRNSKISGYPRFTEGATYWLQSAGFEQDVYNETNSKDDYRNDYMCRGLWVNKLAGGSSRIPKTEGLHIPIDLAYALHSDAGLTKQDSVIGTLTIYRRLSDGKRTYKYGGERLIARDFADILQTQIVSDIRNLYDTDWTRREIWDRSYLEARLPEVPTVLTELLSHQNYSDMVYGLDPEFRFDVSRAIYKGILKYISYLNNESYVVQPLPVESFRIDADFSHSNNVTLTWNPTLDSLEKTAVPEGYIVYTRVTDPDSVGMYDVQPGYSVYGFDNGIKVSDNTYHTDIEPGKIYSFKVTAVNSGGESFPSEILSVGIATAKMSDDNTKIELKNNRPTVLIINNFNRISGPSFFGLKDTVMAGFAYNIDSGSPYKRDISYVGPMIDFNRADEYVDDDNPGFGASDNLFADKVIAGNTFDYPLVHGAAIIKTGCNFVSSSAKGVMGQIIDTYKYGIVDLICGKQIRTPKGPSRADYEVFPEYLRNVLTAYVGDGGNIIVSGAYIGTDSHDSIYDLSFGSDYIAQQQYYEALFCEKILKFKWMSNLTGSDGRVIPQSALGRSKVGEYHFHTIPNQDVYCVESPDALQPVSLGGRSFLRYSDGKSNAGVYYKSPKYKTVCLGFPIETLTSQSDIDSLMSSIISFFIDR